ncbi:MAG: DNA polymerase III subunit gamma/tau C-terminal domain-containing protein, partial [Rhodoferax sp.]
PLEVSEAPAVSAAVAPVAAPLQPWEDAPPGQVLPVRDSGRSEASEDDSVVPAPRLALASKVVAVPVRQQAESRADRPSGQATPELLPTPEGDFWHATVQQLVAAETIGAMVRELALQSQLVARDTDQWLLRVERESLNQSSIRDRLAVALGTAGHAVKLVVEIGRVTDCPARRNGAASAQRQLAADKIIFDDPFVQHMMRDFGAKIVPGSIKPL